MVTAIKAKGSVNDGYLFHMVGPKSEIPTGTFEGFKITNGSLYTETDTGVTNIYDETSQKWVVKSSGGSSGVIIDLDGDGVADDVATDQQIQDITDGLWNDNEVEDMDEPVDDEL